VRERTNLINLAAEALLVAALRLRSVGLPGHPTPYHLIHLLVRGGGVMVGEKVHMTVSGMALTIRVPD
jgi:hypothetical protein